MEDSTIIDLYWARQEQALEETDRKYGSYCWTIAHNILRNRQDTEECVNDTWLKAWNAMPPQRPSILASFLGAITRNLLTLTEGGLWMPDCLDFYRRHLLYTGQTVRCTRGDEAFEGVVLGVQEDFSLLVEVGGTVRVLSSGEISVRVVEP